MQIDMYVSHVTVDPSKLRGKLVVLIDVLRTSSTIITGLQNGCREVIPVESIEDAMKMASNLFSSTTLLCGERQSKIIDGFDLGNSPLEYTPDVIQGKTLVFSTTNGSVALVKTRTAEIVIICGFLNINSVAKYIAETKEDVEILCGGKNNRIVLEDSVCCGMLINQLKTFVDGPIRLTDSAIIADILYDKHADNLSGMLRKSDHGRYLSEIGMDKDIKFCASTDTVSIVPLYFQGVVKIDQGS